VFGSDYITIDHPNLVPTTAPGMPIGQMIDPLAARRNEEALRPLENVEVSDLYMPHVTLRNMSGRIPRNSVFINEHHHGADLVASCLFLDGQLTSTLPGQREGIVVSRGLQSIKYDPDSEYQHWCKADSPFHILHLSIAPAFLFEILPSDEPWTEWLRGQVSRRRRMLSDKSPQITAAQHRVIQNILNCPMQGKMGLLMMETSIIQLILLQFYEQFNSYDNRVATGIAMRDSLSYEVKDHLEKTFLEPHSITALAAHFGTNTSKLMSLFRGTFGHTIFDHIQQLRMEHARMLIADKGYYIAEAAREVGYKNAHHFTAAFKRRYGICPSLIKNQG
jgi:AraC-like DNA-binding protein